MNVDFICVLYVFLGLQCLLAQGEFSCFKKYRQKRNDCGGPVRKKSLSTPDTCCGDIGQGFTEEVLNKIGKNKYKCVSCSEWERQKNSIDSGNLTTPQEDFHCFRKYRTSKQQCGGPIRHSKSPSVESCCNGIGNGFTKTGLVNHGKNKYTCMSCDEWRAGQGHMTTDTVTTPKSTPAPVEWGAWGECNTTCGIGRRVRYRVCPTCERKLHVQSEPCIVQYYCPVDGNWGNWMTWTQCTASCGGGIRRRERFCNNPRPIHGGQDCPGSELDEETCNEEPCELDGHWGPWSRFGSCSRSCGRGEMVRTRECNRPAPSGGGRPCQGRKTDSRRCEDRKCPQHGGWASWEEWSSCPVTCGQGQRTRSRECNRPRAMFGGNPCAGSELDTDVCNADIHCPIHGGWSEWSNFGSCRAGPCQEGHRIRTRVCDNPRPRHRGHLCRGRSVERISCMNDRGCPVDGGWCDFSIWSPCSATCQGTSATRSRQRACDCPPPQHGGKSCQGDFLETIKCEGTVFCPGLVEVQ